MCTQKANGKRSGLVRIRRLQAENKSVEEFSVKLILIFLFIFIVTSEGCAPSDGGSNPSTLCYAGITYSPAVSLTIIINNVWTWGSFDAEVGQALNFSLSGVGWSSGDDGCGGAILMDEPCGPTTDGSYWLMPDGTHVENYCTTYAFKACGIYNVAWVLIGNLPPQRQVQITVK